MDRSKTVDSQDTPPMPSRSKSKVREVWERAGLDMKSLTSMVKFALPPTISLCIFQSDAIAGVFGATGYLVAIGSILSSVLAPRAMYIESTVANILFLSLTTIISIFATWTVLKARETTSTPGDAIELYNSSASAVSALWLFFMVYIINALKFTRTYFKFACVMSSIVTIVSLSYAPQFTKMAENLDLIRKVYGSLMLGIAVATAISLFINPTSCRQIAFRDITLYLSQLRRVLNSEREYLSGLETRNPFKTHAQVQNLRADVQALRVVHGALFAHMGTAKREFAWGKFSPADIAETQRLLRRVFLPLVGISSIIDIFERLSKVHGWGTAEGDPETPSEKELSLEYQDIMQSLRDPIEQLHSAMCDAIDHVLTRLNLARPSGEAGGKVVHEFDIEAGADAAKKNEFGLHLQRRVEAFEIARLHVLRLWCARHGIDLATDSFDSSFDWITKDGENLFGTPLQRQLFVLLYIEFLQWSAANALLSLVRFADSKHEDGTMLRKRLITPGRKTFAKWIKTFARSDQNEDDLENTDAANMTSDTARSLWADTFKSRKDPEHLPPTGSLQKIGIHLRALSKLLRSQHSQFGFRVACAVMSINIISFLRQTQLFFVENRIFWAAIMVAVSMTRTTGQASFIYFLRLCGTLLGAVASFAIFYIVDGHTPGILVFYFLFITLFGYGPVKVPRLALATVIATVTATLVIGYELQVRKIGVIEATSNEQLYYPIYILSPYRLGTTAAGIFVAFFFTIFPFPVSEGSELRRDLGVSLFTLASHYSLVQETVAAQVSGAYGDLSVKTSPGRKLERARVKLMSKHMLLIQTMREQSSFTKWQIPIDAPFPKETYDAIINLIENILNNTALIGYTSTKFVTYGESADARTQEWRNEFGELLASTEKGCDEVTSLLFLISNCILNAQPLPPHLHLPEPYSLLQRLQVVNRDILGISHVAERGYSAFAVMQIASRSITFDLYKLVGLVKDLVGELDFSHPYSSLKLSRYTTNKGKKR